MVVNRMGALLYSFGLQAQGRPSPPVDEKITILNSPVSQSMYWRASRRQNFFARWLHTIKITY